AAREGVLHLEHVHLLFKQAAELRDRDHLVVLVLRLALGVYGMTKEVGEGDAGNGYGVLEGQEQPQVAALVGLKLQNILTIKEDLPIRDHVIRVPHQDVGERALAGAIWPHQGVSLALAHGQVHALQDGLVFNLGVKVANFKGCCHAIRWPPVMRRSSRCSCNIITRALGTMPCWIIPTRQDYVNIIDNYHFYWRARRQRAILSGTMAIQDALGTNTDSTRWLVVRALRARGNATVNDLAEAVGVKPVTVRHHLTSLHAEGLVEVQEERQ